MTQYDILICLKLSNSQLNKLKSGIKNGTEVTLKVWFNVVGDSNDENSFLINYFQLIHKFQDFVKIFQMVHRLK